MLVKVPIGIVFLTLALTAAACASLKATPSRTMTVAEIEQNIRSLDGHTVRLSGEVNNCTSLTCLICDGPEESAACLPLDFHTFSDVEKEAVEELYRFATVVVDARIDATCYPDNTAHAGIVVVCTDRGSAVEDARVVSLESRKPASKGRFTMYEGEPIKAVGDEIYEKIRKVLRDLMTDDAPEDSQLMIYEEAEPSPDSKQVQYYACICREDDCTGQWPAMSGRAWTRSPANPYYCYGVVASDGNWIIAP